MKYDIVYLYADGSVAHSEMIDAIDIYDARERAKEIAISSGLVYSSCKVSLNRKVYDREYYKAHPRKRDENVKMGAPKLDDNYMLYQFRARGKDKDDLEKLSRFLNKARGKTARLAMRKGLDILLKMYELE